MRRPSPVDPAETPLEERAAYTFDHTAAVGELSADSDLLQVITWGVAHQATYAEDGSLLAATYLPFPGTSGFATATAERSLSQAAVRQRCSRASRRLTEAVRTELWDQSTAATA